MSLLILGSPSLNPSRPLSRRLLWSSSRPFLSHQFHLLHQFHRLILYHLCHHYQLMHHYLSIHLIFQLLLILNHWNPSQPILNPFFIALVLEISKILIVIINPLNIQIHAINLSVKLSPMLFVQPFFLNIFAR
jgi:hypothetical protein